MFAAKEQAIVDRLRERLAADVHVGPLRELERVPEYRQKAPAVWVIYDGYTLGDRIPAPGRTQQIVQQWYVVIATKSARGSGEVDAARDAASELVETVLDALIGHHLGGGSYLRLEEAPGPEYDGGYCHVPLAFSNAATFKGTP
jgi:hypothetical protein